MDFDRIGKIVVEALKTKDSVMVYRHIDGMSFDTVFSECGCFRYKLEIKADINEGTKTVCAVMQNPSIANSDIADKSIQFLEKLIFQKDDKEFRNVGRLIVVNQFAYVKTNDFSGSTEHIGPENDKYLREAIDYADIVLIAWGVSNRKRYPKRQDAVNLIIAESGKKKLLQTKKHPSRGTYVDFVIPYMLPG